MYRRGVLGGAAALVAGISGCSRITGGGGGDDSITYDDVLSTTASFYAAAADGDVETVNSLVHPDAPVDSFPTSVIERFHREHAAVQAVERFRYAIGSGYREYRPRIDVAFFRDAPEPFRFAFSLGFRSYDGEPRVYTDEVRDAFPIPPAVDWTITPRTVDPDVRWIDFEHGGGDPIASDRLHARVGDRSRSFFGPDITVEEGVVVRIDLDRPDPRHAAGEPVELLWQPEPLGGGPSEQPCHVIGAHTLAEDSPGFFKIGIVE